MLDVNVYQENIFHTKMHLKDFDLDNYLFEEKAKNLSFKERMKIEARLKREIEELYHGRNLSGMKRPTAAVRKTPVTIRRFRKNGIGLSLV